MFELSLFCCRTQENALLQILESLNQEIQRNYVLSSFTEHHYFVLRQKTTITQVFRGILTRLHLQNART